MCELNSKDNTETQVALNEFDEKVNQNHADEVYLCNKKILVIRMFCNHIIL